MTSGLVQLGKAGRPAADLSFGHTLAPNDRAAFARHVLLFTSGWTAGFSAITALVREHDHIVMDVYSHASLQQGAAAATKRVRMGVSRGEAVTGRRKG